MTNIIGIRLANIGYKKYHKNNNPTLPTTPNNIFSTAAGIKAKNL